MIGNGDHFKTQVAAFRRGYAAGVDNRERDEDGGCATGVVVGRP